MANYKPHRLEIITMAGVRVWVPQDATIITLTDPVAGSTTVDTFQTVLGSIYQVPSGKEYVIVGYQVGTAGVPANVVIGYGDAEDDQDITVATLRIGSTANIIQEFFHSYIVPAGNFILNNPDAVAIGHINIIGYEI